ncbi:PspC domain-containing protein [Amycolatopsis alkalitolerans]|uniref:PspC domain-containing protein n=1 Tax=Amycolatopsis alkalitolerans TaxID=2547244 RepID=A0A5C4M9R8_9PSEU|nr:PspC domain-containing protein [Amycolatopsis alkalitolerans]TNC28104.1 PspC domain-containing protein [Amycolatopsis alkalitolerans]
MTNNVNTIKKLRRSTSDRMIAGVCGGWAEYLGVDASILRIAMVALTVFSGGAAALVYGACWFITPEDTAE